MNLDEYREPGRLGGWEGVNLLSPEGVDLMARDVDNRLAREGVTRITTDGERRAAEMAGIGGHSPARAVTLHRATHPAEHATADNLHTSCARFAAKQGKPPGKAFHLPAKGAGELALIEWLAAATGHAEGMARLLAHHAADVAIRAQLPATPPRVIVTPWAITHPIACDARPPPTPERCRPAVMLTGPPAHHRNRGARTTA